MKIIDIRKTQSGWWADVMLNPSSTIPLSTSIVNCSVDELIEFALTDERHITIHDPRTPAQIEMDTMDKEWKETYQSLL